MVKPSKTKKLPKGIYERNGRFQVRKLVNGKRITETFGNLENAKRWLRELNAQIELGQFRDKSELEKISVGDLVEKHKKENQKRSWVGHYEGLLKSSIAHIKLSDLKVSDIRSWRDSMLKYFSPATVVKRLNLLSSIFNHAISEWDIETPNFASAQTVKRPSGADKKRNRRLTPEEYERILEASKTSCNSDDYWLIKWSVEQGTRLSEALSLKWSDIDFDNSCFFLARVKNDYHREEIGPEERPLSYGAKQVLNEKLSTYSTSPKPKQKIFNCGTKDAFSVRFGRMVKGLDIKDLTFHDLRHEATSRLAKILKESHADSLDLMRFTGHRDVKSLNRYYQPLSKDLADKTKIKD